jgi:hypothetical protein
MLVVRGRWRVELTGRCAASWEGASGRVSLRRARATYRSLAASAVFGRLLTFNGLEYLDRFYFI